jgi:hypothetical protein
MKQYTAKEIIGMSPFTAWVRREDANTEITRLRETLEWFRDFYIGVVHDADHDRKAHRKITEAIGGDK